MPNASEMEQQMEHQMNEYMQDIEAYKNKLNSLHNENVELQHMLVEI
jgi:regulator of replication initiation timing